MMSVSKSFNIQSFPTFLILRGGVEIDRIEGHERMIERLIRSVSQYITDDDKVCHAKSRHRIRLEKALQMGKTEIEEEEDEKGHLSWTWYVCSILVFKFTYVINIYI